MNEIQIERIELFKVPPRWFFLKMTTKDGIVGWGEPIVEGRADTVEACVHELS
ncbi:MAG: D-galactonate dehydratase, partial [Bacteroidota bacterium]